MRLCMFDSKCKWQETLLSQQEVSVPRLFHAKKRFLSMRQEKKAVHIVIVHNHQAAGQFPSEERIILVTARMATRKIIRHCAVRSRIIIGDHTYFSYREARKVSHIIGGDYRYEILREKLQRIL